MFFCFFIVSQATLYSRVAQLTMTFEHNEEAATFSNGEVHSANEAELLHFPHLHGGH